MKPHGASQERVDLLPTLPDMNYMHWLEAFHLGAEALHLTADALRLFAEAAERFAAWGAAVVVYLALKKN